VNQDFIIEEKSAFVKSFAMAQANGDFGVVVTIGG